MNSGFTTVTALAPLRDGDAFGSSVALAHEWAVVGATGYARADRFATAVVNEGAAFLVSATTGLTAAVLRAPLPDVHTDLSFGSAVAVQRMPGSSGSQDETLVVVVGAEGATVVSTRNRGAAYVYLVTVASSGFATPVLARTLVATGGRAHDHFGCAVAMRSTGVAVIGARGSDSYPAGIATADDGGAAYVIDALSGTLLAKLQPADSNGGGLVGCYGFGAAVALGEQLLVIGAPRARAPCVGSTHAGSAFVYSASTTPYTQRAQLTPPHRSGGEGLGASVALHERSSSASNTTVTYMLIGAPSRDQSRGGVYAVGPLATSSSVPFPVEVTASNDATRAAFFTRIDAPLTAGDSPRYGAAVAIDAVSGLALIGSPDARTYLGSDTGLVQLTRQWPPAADSDLLTGSLAVASGDDYGASIAMSSGGLSVVGAPGRNGSGAAFFFHPPDSSPPHMPPPPQPTLPPASPRRFTPLAPPHTSPITPLGPASSRSTLARTSLLITMVLAVVFMILCVCIANIIKVRPSRRVGARSRGGKRDRVSVVPSPPVRHAAKVANLHVRYPSATVAEIEDALNAAGGHAGHAVNDLNLRHVEHTEGQPLQSTPSAAITTTTTSTNTLTNAHATEDETARRLEEWMQLAAVEKETKLVPQERMHDSRLGQGVAESGAAAISLGVAPFTFGQQAYERSLSTKPMSRPSSGYRSRVGAGAGLEPAGVSGSLVPQERIRPLVACRPSAGGAGGQTRPMSAQLQRAYVTAEGHMARQRPSSASATSGHPAPGVHLVTWDPDKEDFSRTALETLVYE